MKYLKRVSERILNIAHLFYIIFLDEGFFHTNSFDKVIGPCCVMHVRDYVRYYHKDFPEERKGTALTVFVCELKYEDKNRQLSPIKKWECPEKEFN
jgi:hypothetical protein